MYLLLLALGLAQVGSVPQATTAREVATAVFDYAIALEGRTLATRTLAIATRPSMAAFGDTTSRLTPLTLRAPHAVVEADSVLRCRRVEPFPELRCYVPAGVLFMRIVRVERVDASFRVTIQAAHGEGADQAEVRQYVVEVLRKDGRWTVSRLLSAVAG
jgi:hypothetical protein